jgi:hypothetical protein
MNKFSTVDAIMAQIISIGAACRNNVHNLNENNKNYSMGHLSQKKHAVPVGFPSQNTPFNNFSTVQTIFINQYTN